MPLITNHCGRWGVDRRFVLRAGALAVGALFLALPTSVHGDVQRAVPTAANSFASDSVIIRLAPGVVASPFGAVAGKVVSVKHEWREDPPATFNQALKEAWAAWRVSRMERAFVREYRDPQTAAAMGLDRYFILRVPERTNTPAMVNGLNAIGGQVEMASLNGVGSVAGLVPGVSQRFPNDPKFCDQYNMHNVALDCAGFSVGTEDADIDAPAAWALTTGEGSSVRIAIIDNGVTSHRDFRERIFDGFNAVDPENPDLTDRALAHGTHVTGIATATGDNGLDVAGVTWGAKILRVKVFEGCCGDEDAVADGILWAVDVGEADVLNMSIQFCGQILPLLTAAVEYAASQGVLMVAAAGNNTCAESAVAAPGRFPEVMAVSGTTEDDQIANGTNTVGFPWKSSFGPEIEVCAPGDFVRSTLRSDSVARLSGTSMASPHVAGLAALMMSFSPGITAAEVRQAIRMSADDLTWNPTGGPPLVGPDIYYGDGRINAFQALRVAGPRRIIASFPEEGTIDGRQPFDLDGNHIAGLDVFQLFFAGGGGTVSSITSSDLFLSEGGDVALPIISSLIPDDSTGALTVILNRSLSPGVWTTITHLPSATSIMIGFLPGDLDGSALVDGADVDFLLDALDASALTPLSLTIDVDRSGEVNGHDVLRLIDMLNGAEAYDPPFLGDSLP